MAAALEWGSWVGADRDGNPNVTAETTVAAMRIQSDHVLRGYEAVARRLMATIGADLPAARVPTALAERLALRLNELAEAEIARAHHGSLAREQRTVIEEDLKAGRIPCLVATSSLELGIDMGAVDLVIQVESPKSVARGLQRIGRAGHQVGEISRGVVFPKHRADLIRSAVATERMTAGLIESIKVPANPLDILAQQIVAAEKDGVSSPPGFRQTILPTRVAVRGSTRRLGKNA